MLCSLPYPETYVSVYLTDHYLSSDVLMFHYRHQSVSTFQNETKKS